MTIIIKKHKNKLLYLFIALLISFVGCQKLDFVDPNGPSLEQTNPQTLVTGIEAGMRNGVAVRLEAIIGREAYYLDPEEPRYTGTVMGKNGTQLAGFGDGSWAANYRVIRNCNILISESEGDNGAKGFARTIIAYELLMNLDLTYDNGIKIDVAGKVPGPLVSKDEALAYIIKLLDDAKANLENTGASFSFKLSNGFSDFNTPVEFLKFNRGLKARVSIYQKKYSEALTALNSSFVDRAASLRKGVYLDYGTGVGDQLNPIYEVPTSTQIRLYTHPSFVADAEAGDKRVASKVFVRSKPMTLDGLTSKFGQTVFSSSTAPFPLMRNEELILDRAEANIGLGNYSAAEIDINFIRNSAGLGNVTLNSTNALDELLKQKRYSLFLEGFRWIDMRLYGKLGELPIDRPGDVVHKEIPIPLNESF